MNALRIIFLVIGLCILSSGVFSCVRFLDYSKWPCEVGRLHSISVRNLSAPTVGGASDWGSDIFYANYTYQVGGASYKGFRIAPLQNVYLSRAFVGNFQTGEVKVFFNPDNPDESYLSVSFPLVQLSVLAFFGFISLAFGAVLPTITRLFKSAIIKNA